MTGRYVGLRAIRLRIRGLFVQIKGDLSKNVKAALTGLSVKGLRLIELEVLQNRPHGFVRLKKIRRR